MGHYCLLSCSLLLPSFLNKQFFDILTEFLYHGGAKLDAWVQSAITMKLHILKLFFSGGTWGGEIETRSKNVAGEGKRRGDVH